VTKHPAAGASAFFLAASLLTSLALALVTPPFQAADEAAHFFRAYRVSEGSLDLLPRAGTDRATIEVPEGLVRAGSVLYQAPPFRAERKISVAELRVASQVAIGETPVTVFAPNTLMYTFVPYAPQAFGIALARSLGGSALGVLYAGRIANLLVASIVIAFAVARAPAYRWLIAALALTPMAVSLRGSLSPDAIVLAAATLLTAEIAALAWGRTAPIGPSPEPPRRRLHFLLVAAGLLCAAKFAYLPLCLLALLVPPSRWPLRRSAALAAYAATVVAAASLAVVAARSVSAIRFDARVDPAAQVAHALSHPFASALVILRDAAQHAPRYAAQLVGKLGWLDVPLPVALIVSYLLLLLALLAIDGSPGVVVRRWQRWTVAGVTIGGAAAVIASQYVMWTPVGASFVEGVQGRYFLPLAVAAIWCCHGSRWAREERIKTVMVVVSTAVSSVVAAGALAAHYYRW
jgi:uncharacterized membrane protein